MDGVIWKDNQPIGNLPEIFDSFKQRGYRVMMATNNATLSIEHFIKKLANMGVELEEWQVVNSALATAHYLKKLFPEGGAVYIIGESGLKDTLEAFGFMHADSGVIAVVAGLDRQLTYERLKKASLLIQSGLPFIGTNMDTTLPTPEGLIPGAGTILAALQTASGVKPVIMGKPEPQLYTIAIERLGTNPNETLVIGDRLETDIAGGQKLGCRTCIVLSGVANQESAQNWKPAPDIITNDLTSLLSLI